MAPPRQHCISVNSLHLLTYSMVQSPSWAPHWFAASQEIPRISRNAKVHYRTHKRPPPVSILGHPNPVHIPTSHLVDIHPNIIHPSTPRSPQWSLSFRFPHQDPIHPISSPIRATCPAHSLHIVHKINSESVQLMRCLCRLVSIFQMRRYCADFDITECVLYFNNVAICLLIRVCAL